MICYWFLSLKGRLLLIFCASLIFYGFWNFAFIPLLLFSCCLDFYLAQKIPKSSSYQKNLLVIISVTINLSILFYFKYLIFFANETIGFLSLFNINIDPIFSKVVLPLGISFYTFQTISYIIDVYREIVKPEKKLLAFSCYVIFFPQLIAGPILRASDILPQFSTKIKFNFEQISTGVKKIIIGLFLKVVLADNISPLVDTGFNIPTNTLSALDVWTLSFLFGFQIYFDFSAYSFIAIGTAALFGLNFPNNFMFPYMSKSPKDFWRRWHISLSSWIRDYLYLPLAGRKISIYSGNGLGDVIGADKRTKALFASWALMGFWHGANWTFLLWGTFHSLIIFVYRILETRLKIIPDRIRAFFGFCITLPLMMIAWIPFRSENITDAFNMWSKIFFISNYSFFNLRENSYLVAAIILIGMIGVYFARPITEKIRYKYSNLILISETLFFSILTLNVFVFLRPIKQFIYFQF